MEILYQPIVDLASDSVKGYEALARFPDAPPDVVFAEAWQESPAAGQALELEAARLAIRGFEDRSTSGPYLSINFSAKTIINSLDGFIKSEHAVLPWNRFIVEITEHESIAPEEDEPLHAALNILRSKGGDVALDDVGSGGHCFGTIVRVKPGIIKIDKSLTQSLHTSLDHQAVFEAFVLYANRTGKLVVAEGIENAAVEQQCKDLGVNYGQGYHHGRPAPLPAMLN